MKTEKKQHERDKWGGWTEKRTTDCVLNVRTKLESSNYVKTGKT